MPWLPSIPFTSRPATLDEKLLPTWNNETRAGAGASSSTPPSPTLVVGRGGRFMGFRQRRWLVLAAVVVVVVFVGRGWRNVSPETATTYPEPAEPEADPVWQPGDADLDSWGITSPTRGELLHGLSSWPSRTPSTPISSLGAAADEAYTPGPSSVPSYSTQLREFVLACFPAKHIPALLAGLDGHLTGLEMPAWDSTKNIWQTDKDGSTRDSHAVQSWSHGEAINEGWNWTLLSDAQAWDWAREEVGGSRIGTLWTSLPTGILRSDLLRYLLLLLRGGIYSDTDTNLLRPPSAWPRHSVPWKDGEGWMSAEQRARVAAGQDLQDVLGPPSVVVGVEADVGEREDWAMWWPRPLQIVQWTMAAAPHHPIALQSVLRVLHATATAADWAAAKESNIAALKTKLESLQPDSDSYKSAKHELDTLVSATVLKLKKDGGPVGILDWTGPGVWTDATLNYLEVKYGTRWTDLRGLDKPLRVGDVLVLPVTGFSPGVGNFGAGDRHHHLAMVFHQFRGSWREADDAAKRPMGMGY